MVKKILMHFFGLCDIFIKFSLISMKGIKTLIIFTDNPVSHFVILINHFQMHKKRKNIHFSRKSFLLYNICKRILFLIHKHHGIILHSNIMRKARIQKAKIICGILKHILRVSFKKLNDNFCFH